MSFQRNRGQLTNAVSFEVVVASPVDAVAVAEPAGRVGFDSMMDLWTDSFSSTYFVVIELMTP
jgi:hypothetical protein